MTKCKILCMLVVILLLTRVVVLLFSADKFFMFEELHHGMIAKEVMEGADLPIFEYQLRNYGHGGLWSGILTIPFFALFGKNLFALLLTPVAFSAAILTVLFLFAYKFFNRRVAIITGLLYVFSSRIWFTFNLHNGGLHYENIIFTVGAMYVFYEIIFSGKSRPGYFFLLGLISGFGAYWVYTYLITIAAILLLWFLRDNKMFTNWSFYIFLTGFLVGMLPWFCYNYGTNFESVNDVLFNGFLMDKDYLKLNTWLDIIKRFLRNIYFSGMLSITGHNDFFGNLYLIVYYLGFLHILRSYRLSFRQIICSRDSMIVIFPVLLFSIIPFYGEQPFATSLNTVPNSSYMEWRYVVSFFPFLFLTVAIALDRLFIRLKSLKAVFAGLLSIPVIWGGGMWVMSVNLKDFGRGFNQQGYSYAFLADAFIYKYQDNLYKILDNITRLSVPERYEVISQIFDGGPMKNVRQVDFGEYLKLSFRLDGRYRPVFYKILIKGLFRTMNLSMEDVVRQVDILSNEVDDRYKPYLYEGLGALATEYVVINTVEYKDYASLIDKRYVAYYYRGLSEPNYLEGITEHFNRIKSCLSWLDEQYQPLYLEGVGEVLAKMGAWYTVVKECCNEGDTGEFYKLLANIDPAYKIQILSGMGKGLAYFHTVNTDKTINEFIGNFNDDDKKIIIAAMTDNLR